MLSTRANATATESEWQTGDDTSGYRRWRGVRNRGHPPREEALGRVIGLLLALGLSISLLGAALASSASAPAAHVARGAVVGVNARTGVVTIARKTGRLVLHRGLHSKVAKNGVR